MVEGARLGGTGTRLVHLKSTPTTLKRLLEEFLLKKLKYIQLKPLWGPKEDKKKDGAIRSLQLSSNQKFFTNLYIF